MKAWRHGDQRGIAHILEILVVGLIALGVGGFVIWRVWNAQQTAQTGSSDSSLQAALANAKCDFDDKDICKFLTSWKASSSFEVNSSITVDGQTTSSTYQSSDGGKKYHIVTDVNGMPYEVIVIDGTTYSKATDGTWWKQTSTPSTSAQPDYAKDYNYDFKSPEATDQPQQAAAPVYTKLGTEGCGDLQCFKYKVIDPSASDQTQYLWFDTKDYQLRRLRVESQDSTSDQTFAYGTVNIVVPSPVKDLGANQYLLPGQAEPTTIPTL